jgi:hypothetical protein
MGLAGNAAMRTESDANVGSVNKSASAANAMTTIAQGYLRAGSAAEITRTESDANAGNVNKPMSAVTTTTRVCLRAGSAVGRGKSSGV